MLFPTDKSYGPSFNDEGGGWYVMYIIKQLQKCLQLNFRFAVERTDCEINVWFWSRCSLFVPYEVKESTSTVDPLTWVCEFSSISMIVFVNTIWQGFPVAHFPNTFCNMTSHFSEHNIIINLTLCKSPFLSFFSVLLSIRDQF